MSKLPELIELVMSRPLVSSGMIAKSIDVTPQVAVKIVGEPRAQGDDGEGEV